MGCGCNGGGGGARYSPPSTYQSKGQTFTTRKNSIRFRYVSPGGSETLYDTPTEVATALEANKGGSSTQIDTATGREIDP